MYSDKYHTHSKIFFDPATIHMITNLPLTCRKWRRWDRDSLLILFIHAFGNFISCNGSFSHHAPTFDYPVANTHTFATYVTSNLKEQ
jgi:hypothetical protein